MSDRAAVKHFWHLYSGGRMVSYCGIEHVPAVLGGFESTQEIEESMRLADAMLGPDAQTCDRCLIAKERHGRYWPEHDWRNK